MISDPTGGNSVRQRSRRGQSRGIKYYRAGYPAAGRRGVCCRAKLNIRRGDAWCRRRRFKRPFVTGGRVHHRPIMQQGERTYLIVMQPDERGDPVVPHSVDCDGYLIVEEHGKMADLKCNSCGAVVDTVPLARSLSRM